MDPPGYWVWYCFNHVARAPSDSLSTNNCIVLVPWHHNIDGSGNGGMGLWSHDIIQYEVITTEQHSTVHRTPANSITDKHYNSYSQCLMSGYSATVHKSFATS